jgi:ABC-type antimicrobial peptide transport system permease subunit
VINQAMVEEVWPGEDPLGKRFSLSDEPPEWRTVVGVVGDVRQWGPERPAVAQVYFPFSQGWTRSGFMVIRTAGDAMSVVPQVRSAIRGVDPTQPPSDIRAMGDRLESAFAQRKFYTTLIGLFAVAALLLASAGVYGTVSYFVSRRIREVGIRLALGADRSGVMGLVLARGVRLAAWGIAIGLPGVWASTSLIDSLVYGMGVTEPLILLGGCVVLGGVAVLASVLPALRAVRVSPVTALRAE